MKFSNLLRHAALVLAPLGLASLPVSAYTVTIDETLENPGFNIYQYLATDSLGNIIALESLGIDWNWVDDYDEEGNWVGEHRDFYLDGEPTFRGVQTSAETYTLPDQVKWVIEEDGRIYELTAPINRFAIDNFLPTDGISFGNGFLTTFPDCDNLKNIIVPDHYSYCNWRGSGFINIPNFYFSSKEVPWIDLEWNAEKYVTIWVDDDLFFDYADCLDYALVKSTTPAVPVTLNVATAGTLASVIEDGGYDYGNLRDVTITGSLNLMDLSLILQMNRLERLDLSGVTGLTEFKGCRNLQYLENVALPKGIVSIGEKGFYNCHSLKMIELPQSVTAVKYDAFSECWNLTSVNLGNVTEMENHAFYNCNLSAIDISKLKGVPYNAFHSNRNLSEVIFSDEVEIIEDGAFAYCAFTEMVLPESLRCIGWDAFAQNEKMKKVVFNANLHELGNSFAGCRPDLVIVNYSMPFECSGFNAAEDLMDAEIFVPAFTYSDFCTSDAWFDVCTRLKKSDLMLGELNITSDFSIKTSEGLAKDVKVKVGEADWTDRGIGLTVDTPMSIGTYTQYGRSLPSWYSEWINDNEYVLSPYNGSTLISNAKVSADEANVNIQMNEFEWKFLTFPYDVNIKDIKASNENAVFVVRKYSGADRAAKTGNTWHDVNDVMKAGEGYIFQYTTFDNGECSFCFPAASNAGALFNCDEVAIPLAKYESEFDHNASWNLVGNTYPAYVDIDGISFDAPITLYEDGHYNAYRRGDDNYVFHPFQAFFVQGVTNDVLTIDPAARAHNYRDAAAKAPRRVAAKSDRSLFNIYIKSDEGQDRARIVVNENASCSYEASVDAAKFMSSDTKGAQIYVSDAGTRLAIDERPLGVGVFSLGASFAQKGEYVISLSSRNADGYKALLTDSKLGVTTDITDAEYAFEANAGIDDNRFAIALVQGKESGVDSSAADDIKVEVKGNMLLVSAPQPVAVTVVAADGTVAAAGESVEFSADLTSGVYVVKAGEKISKIIVK